VRRVVLTIDSPEDTKTPVLGASISLISHIILSISFLGVFFSRVKNGGPGLATALATFFDFFALLIIFRWRHGSMGMTEAMRSFAKISLCSAIMAAACWVGNRYTAFTVHSRFLFQLVVFAGLLTGATALYLALAWIFRC